ncbi:MAG: hypothetical protein BWY78_00392 [Alphaproteobacteria bacterium ADurb.Bin438]|nr:MAG: hypothetical protein BWY78_00392 [Alphaproteobacteria bacterium ADurb.Bin438]
MEQYDLNYEICGGDLQFLEISLNPGQGVIAEAGSLMFKSGDIKMEAMLGNGGKSNIFSKLFGATKRAISGENMFVTGFINRNKQSFKKVAFAGPYPGHIVPISLSDGEIICQSNAFICASFGTSVDFYIQKSLTVGFFGGKGFLMQKLKGDGVAFIHVGGSCKEIYLEEDEEIHIETGSVAAYDKHMKVGITLAGGIKTQIFGGEGLFLSTIKGPGRVWIQSMPFNKFVSNITATQIMMRKKK